MNQGSQIYASAQQAFTNLSFGDNMENNSWAGKDESLKNIQAVNTGDKTRVTANYIRCYK